MLQNKTILLIYLCIGFFLQSFPLYGQTDCDTIPDAPCCNEVITTNPDNPSNTERPSMVNNFDWRTTTFNVFHPITDKYTVNDTQPFALPNPYFSTMQYLSPIGYFNLDFQDRIAANLDFHPEDGWELIKRGNGFEMDEETLIDDNSNNRNGPYVILYNKYSSTIRVLAAFAEIENPNEIITRLAFQAGTNLNYSGLFSHYMGISRPLDSTTLVNSVSKGSSFPINGEMFQADFQVAYDPCVCDNRSTFLIQFYTMDEMDVSMSGRLIGTSVPLDGSGNDPLLNGRDFISSVFTDDTFSIKGGLLTYSNIDTLVDRYEKNVDFFSIIKSLGYDILENTLKSGLEPIADQVDDWLGEEMTDIFHAIRKLDLGRNPRDTVDVSVGVASAAVKNFTSSLSPGKPKIPNIHFIEGELAMSGKIIDTNPIENGDIQIAQPGSKYTSDSVIITDNVYPIYNEALGLFAVLETPSVTRYYNRDIDSATGITFDLVNNYEVKNYVDRVAYKFNGDLKYVFNPAVDIDLDKTSISVGLEVNWNPNFLGSFEISQPDGTVTADYDSLETDEFLLVSITNQDSAAGKAHSNFYRLECAEDQLLVGKELRFSTIGGLGPQPPVVYNYLAGDSAKVFLKIQIKYKFQSTSSSGGDNIFYATYTYPVDIVEGGSPTLFTKVTEDALPNDLEIGPTVYIKDRLIQATGTIKITGDLLVLPGNTVTIRAGGGIDIDPNVSLSDNIILEANSKLLTFGICDEPPVAQVNSDALKTFCQGSKYKAKTLSPNAFRQARNSSEEGSGNNSEVKQQLVPLTAFPNPTTGQLTLRFELEESAPVRITIFDLMGAPVLPVQDQADVQAGTHEVSVDMSRLAAGMYHVVMEANGKKQTVKVVKSK